MLIRNSASCFAFWKRSIGCIKQHLSDLTNSWYLGCQIHHGVFVKNLERPDNPSILLNKTSLPNGDIKELHFLKTRKFTQILFGQFLKPIGGHPDMFRNFWLRQFSTDGKGKAISNPSSVNEHWGPYLVSRIHNLEESSRFHGYSTLRWGLSIIIAVLAGVYLFRDKLRDNVADEVADVASRSMADENVIIKAHDMTKEVLERLTSEEDTIALVSGFLKAVLQQSDVQNTAVVFATMVLNHPQTQEKLKEVMKNTLHSILNNKETKDLLLQFIKSLIEDAKTKETCNVFMQSLTKDPDIQKMVSEFFKSILASPVFQLEAVMLGREVTNKVVHDKNIQKQTGDALWNAVKYGVTPHWFRDEN